MAREVMTMDRYSEIKRQLELSVSVIQISRNLNCSERTVRQVRDHKILSPEDRQKNRLPPVWAMRADWDLLIRALDNLH